ncbi:MAG: transglutaminase family protein [Spirochaetes bacterium]|nr:transglutaminase family protein [Spirochaetota bacterium]
MRLQILHRTCYRYGSAVRDNFNEVRLMPYSDLGQRCESFLLAVDPQASTFAYTDIYGNIFHQFQVFTPHAVLEVCSTSRVETPGQPLLYPGAPSVPLGTRAAYPAPDGYFDFLGPSTFVSLDPEVRSEARGAAGTQRDAWQAAQALMHHVHRSLAYLPESTHVHTHMREVLASRRGVCQDFAHVLLGLLRSLDLSARYVSGYLYNGPRETLKGAQASHAWVEVFLPGIGWAGLDPTNDQVVVGRHIKVAHGRDYADVPPVKGTYRGTGDRKLTVEVRVESLEAQGDVPPQGFPAGTAHSKATS